MSQPDDHARAYLLFDPAELEYDFGEGHPLQPHRLVALMALLESSGLWQRTSETGQLPLRAATDEELELVHTADYIAAVKQLSVPETATSYDEPRVMKVSLHETGRYLFPGTGDILELGRGLGRGYSVNVPLEPFTEDESYIEVLNALLSPLALSFAPDVILSVHGCDTHAWDPLDT